MPPLPTRDRPVTPPRDQDTPLTALITALADGQPAGDLERAILRLHLIKQAQNAKLSWTAIAAALGYPSGRQLKKDTHRLAQHVTRQLKLAQNQNTRHNP